MSPSRQTKLHHRGFLNARKAWVWQRNEGGPDRTRLKSKKKITGGQEAATCGEETRGQIPGP